MHAQYWFSTFLSDNGCHKQQTALKMLSFQAKQEFVNLPVASTGNSNKWFELIPKGQLKLECCNELLLTLQELDYSKRVR